MRESGLLLTLFVAILLCVRARPSLDEVRLSDVSVLLPYNNKVSHIIEAFNGCFDWKANNPALVQIEVLDDCGRRVRVHAHSDSAFTRRDSSWLIATEKSTKRVLRCELFVDRVAKLEVLTTTRKIYKDVVERFDLQAFDAAGNKFSSIEGLVFDWGIQPARAQQAAANSILTFVHFKDSGLEASDLLKQIEESGKRSTAILVRGLQTGRVVVSARLVDTRAATEDQALSTAVEVAVHEPLELDPSEPVYVAPNARFAFALNTYRANRVSPIPLPNAKYEWSSSDAAVAGVTSAGLASALQLGTSVIACASADLPENQAQTMLNVVKPNHFVVEITEIEPNGLIGRVPNKHNFQLVLGQPYHFNMAVFDKEHHRFHTSDGLEFDVHLCAALLGLNGKAAPNNGQFNVTTLALGTCEIVAILKTSVEGDTLAPVKQTINVVPPVKILPTHERIVLPIDSLVKHQYSLTAEGGSVIQGYIWSSSAPSVAVASALGVVKGESEGKAIVRVQDGANPNNFATIEVIVAPPASIDFVEGALEVPVDSSLTLSSRLATATGLRFTNCSALPLSWEQGDDKIFRLDVEEKPSESCCGEVRLLALREGTTLVRVKYANLVASTLIAAFTKLAVSHDRVVVSLGASFSVTTIGGPSPWTKDPAKYLEEVLVGPHADAVSVSAPRRAPASGEHAAWRQYVLTCRALGDHTIVFKVGNQPSPSNPKPYVADVSLSYTCSVPHSLFVSPLVTDVPPDTPHHCAEFMGQAVDARGTAPIDRVPTIYRLRSGRTLPFSIDLYNDQAQRFNNFSTVRVEWRSLTPELLSIHPEPNAPLSVPSGAFGAGTIELLTKDFKVADVHGKDAHIVVTAVGYDQAALSVQRSASANFAPVKKEFTFNLYERLQLTSERYSVFLHENNSVSVQPFRGSGDFSIDVNSTSVAAVQKNAPAGSAPFFTIGPLAEGVVAVELRDLCVPSDRAQTAVFVSLVRAIRLRGRDAVEAGTSMEVVARVEDKFGNAFPDDQYRWFHLEARVSDDTILTARHMGASRFVLTGRAVGYTSLTVTAESSGALATSQPLSVFVYPTFTLKPSRLVLVPGAEFKLQWVGATPSMTAVAFSAPKGSEQFIELDPTTGRVRARAIGSVVVEARATKENSDDGEVFEVGISTTQIEIRPLKAIRIASSSNRMLVGGVQTLQIIGYQPDETPFSWGNLAVRFKWEALSTSAELKPIYANADVSLEAEASFAVRLHAIAPGRTTIRVTIIDAPESTGLRGLETTQTIDVVEPLRLLSPSELLLAPGSHYTLRTNYAALNRRLFYSLLDGAQCRRTGSSSIVSVSDEGRITASHTAGTAWIYISDSNLDAASLSQSVVVKVLVKPVQQLSLSPSRPAAYQLPVGAEQEFRLHMRDELGLEFHSFDSIDFEALLNVLDVAAVTIRSGALAPAPNASAPAEAESEGRASLLVSAVAPGRVIARIQTVDKLAGDQRLSAFLPIEVTNAILPQSSRVLLGGSVAFSARFNFNASAYRTPWSTNDSSILDVDASRGVASGRAPGSALVFHNSSVQTHAVVEVVPLTGIEEGPQQIIFRRDSLVIIADLRYKSGAEVLYDSPFVKHGVKLDCAVEQSTFGDRLKVMEQPSATPDQPAKCVLTLKVDNFTQLSWFLGPTAPQPRLRIRASPSGHPDKGVAASFPLKAEPLFFPESTDIEVTDEPAILPIHFKQTDAHNLPELIVSKAGGAELAVRVAPNQPGGPTRHYQIAVLLGAEANVKRRAFELNLTHPTTHQEVQIRVSYTPGRRFLDDSSASFVLPFLGIIAAMVVGALGVFTVWSLRRVDPTAPAPAPAPAAPSLNPPLTPNIYRGRNYAPPSAAPGTAVPYTPSATPFPATPARAPLFSPGMGGAGVGGPPPFMSPYAAAGQAARPSRPALGAQSSAMDPFGVLGR